MLAFATARHLRCVDLGSIATPWSAVAPLVVSQLFLRLLAYLVG